MEHTFKVKNRGPTIRRAPRGFCIYCGSRKYRQKGDRKLGEEHVIAEGLGGTLVLEEATCEACERVVNRFEQAILKTVLYAPRVHLGVRRKRRKRKEEAIKVQGKRGGEDIEIFLPIDRVPVLLFLLNLGPPGILVGRPPGVADVHGAWLRHLSELLLPRGFQSLASPILDTFKFSQFIAKVAHCYATDALGDGFVPMLTEMIKGEPEARYDLIGGALRDDPPSDSLHELGLSWRQIDQISYAVVSIRLFANLGVPTYLAVAGKPKPHESGSLLEQVENTGAIKLLCFSSSSASHLRSARGRCGHRLV